MRLQARLSLDDERNLVTLYDYFKVTGGTDSDKLRQLLTVCAEQINNYQASENAKGNGDKLGFNPCFDGLPFWTCLHLRKPCLIKYCVVSILVLMDYLFGPTHRLQMARFRIKVSILVLMDYLFGQAGLSTME